MRYDVGGLGYEVWGNGYQPRNSVLLIPQTSNLTPHPICQNSCTFVKWKI